MRIETIHCDGCGAIQAADEAFGQLHLDTPQLPGWNELRFRIQDLCQSCANRVIDAMPVTAMERNRRINQLKETGNGK